MQSFSAIAKYSNQRKEGNEQWDYAAWDFNGEALDPNYWYFAWYHPEDDYSSGYCHAWTKVTDQNNSGEYCYDDEGDWVCETQNYHDYGYCEFRVND
ncbi:MAG: hypothetical protein FJY07_13220 [Bacteroidetes bacterium]|nr:hypothetical protein [Bacteroidota bacterium]